MTDSASSTEINPAPSWRDFLPVHPAANLFPLMSPEELRKLGEDIDKNGLKLPIALWRAPGSEAPAQLLDGRNRLDAIEAAIGPIVSILPYIVVDGGRLIGSKVVEAGHTVDPYS